MSEIFIGTILIALFICVAGFLSIAALEFYNRKKTIKKFDEEEAEIWLP